MHRLLFTIFATTLFLAACAQQVAFPLEAPSSDVLDEKYQALQYHLPKNPNYHFSILIPNEWKVLQASIENEPSKNEPLELVIFREPGPWMENDAGAISGEIVANIVNLSGSTLTDTTSKEYPDSWLKSRLKKHLTSFTILEERTFKSSLGTHADLLARFGTERDGFFIGRFSAFHMPSTEQMFVLTASAPEENYEKNAEAFATAVMTLKLDKVEEK